MINNISIHAPTRGATKAGTDVSDMLKEFQSTLPREERLGRNARSLIFLISIHAPTRGATTSPPEISAYLPFQSTLPREERPFCQAPCADC